MSAKLWSVLKNLPNERTWLGSLQYSLLVQKNSWLLQVRMAQKMLTHRISSMKLFAFLSIASLMSVGFRNPQMSETLSRLYRRTVPSNAIGQSTGILGANVRQIAMWFRNYDYFVSMGQIGPILSSRYSASIQMLLKGFYMVFKSFYLAQNNSSPFLV